MKAAAVRRVVAGVVIAGLAAVALAKDPKPMSKAKAAGEKKSDDAAKADSVLDFRAKDIDGKDVELSKYKGNVLLIVNTASKCGYTPQYKSLEALYGKYHEQGLVVLGFPCNDFGSQEPGSEADIKKFCTDKFAVTFPMFSKVKVKGKDACDLYKFLTSKETDPKFAGPIEWNFTKFLVDRDGNLVGRFKPSDEPLKNKKLIEALEKSLAAKPSDAKKG